MVNFHGCEQVDLGLGDPDYQSLIQEADHNDGPLGAKGELGFHLKVAAVEYAEPCPWAKSFQQVKSEKKYGQKEKHCPQHLEITAPDDIAGLEHAGGISGCPEG